MSINAQSPAASALARYADAKACGTRYGFSWRHWLRLVDAGKAPPPIRFGRLVRWSLDALEAWERDGCKACRHVAARGGQG